MKRGRIKYFFVFILDLILIPLLVFCVWNPGMSNYLVGQAKGQLSIIFNAEDINNLKKSGRFKGKDLEKIELLEKIKAYSVKDLGFKPSKSYCKFYDQKNRSLIWIVTACAPFKLEAYEWDFPLLGGLSYKGFFDSLKAVQESAKLKKMGFDSDISAVQAWSTLGYLNDPLFSEMLKKSKGEFVELILHELFHGTIYAPGSVDLNENLAEFVAKNATLDFLKNDTSELRLYLMKKELEQKIDLLMLECIATLKSEYVKISPQTSLEDKKIIKKSALEKAIALINGNGLIPQEKKKKTARRVRESGNAFFMHYQRYNSKEDSLNEVLKNKFHGRLNLMINDLKKNISSL